ncbi:coiled-coil domain-containing protein 142 [Aplochiton taeniatus]
MRVSPSAPCVCVQLLSTSIEKLLQHTEALTVEEDLCSPNHLHHILFKQQNYAIRQAVLELQTFSEQVLRIFSMDCKRMSGEIFEQTMPSAKHWRLDYKSEFPSSPSIYAASAAQSVIGQVLKGVEPLPDEDRVRPLAEAMTAFMEAWMEHILKQKIKFSIQGALQLKQDFELIRDLIQSEEYSLSSELHQRLLSLRVFQQVDSAIMCLLQQPMAKPYLPSRSWEPFRHCCPNRDSSVEQTSRGSIMALESMEGVTVCQEALSRFERLAVGPDLPTTTSTTTPESYLALGTAQQDWLNLRFHSASRWRVPGMHCLSNSEP